MIPVLIHRALAASIISVLMIPAYAGISDDNYRGKGHHSYKKIEKERTEYDDRFTTAKQGSAKERKEFDESAEKMAEPDRKLATDLQTLRSRKEALRKTEKELGDLQQELRMLEGKLGALSALDNNRVKIVKTKIEGLVEKKSRQSKLIKASQDEVSRGLDKLTAGRDSGANGGGTRHQIGEMVKELSEYADARMDTHERQQESIPRRNHYGSVSPHAKRCDPKHKPKAADELSVAGLDPRSRFDELHEA